jgi:EamA domain-containing membrane protein RarD
MIVLVVLLLIPVAMLVAGYLELSEAISRQAATGVTLIALGIAAEVWLLNNITW